MSQIFLGRGREACDLFPLFFSSLTTLGMYHWGVPPLVRSWERCLWEREGAGGPSASTEEHLLGFSWHRTGKISCSNVCISINFGFIQAQIFLEITSIKTTAKHREKHRILPRKCSSCGVGYHWLTGKPSFLQACVLAALLASNQTKVGDF